MVVCFTPFLSVTPSANVVGWVFGKNAFQNRDSCCQFLNKVKPLSVRRTSMRGRMLLLDPPVLNKETDKDGSSLLPP